MMRIRINNLAYRFHVWLDNNETIKFISMFFIIGLPMSLIVLGGNTLIFIGLSVMIITCLLTLTRVSYIVNSLKFDRSIYSIPKIDDVLLITKDIFYSGHYRKLYKRKKGEVHINGALGSNPLDLIEKNEKLKVLNIEEINGDWRILVQGNNRVYYQFRYFNSRRFYKIESEYVANKRKATLRKIGV